MNRRSLPVTAGALAAGRVEVRDVRRTRDYPVEMAAADGLVAVGVSVVRETDVRRYVDAVRLR